MSYTFHTLAQRPEYRQRIHRLSAASWPPYLLEGNITRWKLLFDMFPEYQLLLCDAEDHLAAVGHTVPLFCNGQLSDLPHTLEEILIRAEQIRQHQQTPNTFSALSAVVSAEHRRKRLSSRVIREMKALAQEQSCSSLIAPVRPIWKSRYPLIPMERYVNWTRDDGTSVDPWIRVHRRLGAVPLRVAPNTLTVEAGIAAWEEWTGMRFYGSGAYIIPGALQPAEMDLENDLGRYEDPNYWMKHPID